MQHGQPETIPQLDAHKDLAELQEHDFPPQSMTRAKALLTAKAWTGEDLACFFSLCESPSRFVVLFYADQSWSPALGGSDMRTADIGAAYELTIFLMLNRQPVVERADALGRVA